MKNKQLVRFVEAFIMLPTLTMSSVPVGSISQVVVNIVNTPQVVLSQEQNKKSEEQLAIEKARTEKAQAVDAYFKERNMPLAGQGMKMILEAEKNEIDWRLLPAIAVRESTGGKFACKKATYNSFGWGSCKISFDSNEKAIEIVARNLGGNNPNTDHHYAGKTTKQILQKYNPPSVVPRYAEQVMAIMDKIGVEEVNSKTLAVNM